MWSRILIVLLASLAACTPDQKRGAQEQQTAVLVEEGLQLAEIHCSSCHAFPAAEILPTTYWGKVLPIMGFFLGAGKEKYQFADYLNPIAKQRLAASGLFPET